MQENQFITGDASAGKSLLSRFFTSLPIFFPLIGLFLAGLTVFEGWNWLGDDSVSRAYWLRPFVLLVYTLCWVGACLLKKPLAVAFITLSIINVSFHLFAPNSLLKRALGDLLFVPLPVNLVFSFLLLFYFRKMK